MATQKIKQPALHPDIACLPSKLKDMAQAVLKAETVSENYFKSIPHNEEILMSNIELINVALNTTAMLNWSLCHFYCYAEMVLILEIRRDSIIRLMTQMLEMVDNNMAIKRLDHDEGRKMKSILSELLEDLEKTKQLSDLHNVEIKQKIKAKA